MMKISFYDDADHSFLPPAFSSLYSKKTIMTYIISQPETSQGYAILKEQTSLLSRFIQWATDEDKKHHIAWVGASVTSMTAVFFPLTMSAILLNGASFGLIITAMVSLVLV